MNYVTFLAQTEKKLKLTMPFLTKEMITNRAQTEWAKFQRKQTPKQNNNNKKQRTAPAKKQPRGVSSFREKLNTLSSDFTPCETPKTNSDALFDTVYNLRPKTKPKTNDAYDFLDRESDVIPSTLPPLMSNVGKTKKTNNQKPARTVKRPQPVKTATKNQNKTRVRFVDDVNEKENRFVPIETVTETAKMQKTSKKLMEPSILSPQIDHVIPETQLDVDKSDERVKSPDISMNLSDKQVGVVPGSEDDQEKEKYMKTLTFAIEKLTEKLKMPSNALLNLGGHNNNIYWQITITNRTPRKLSATKKYVDENDISDVFVEENEFSQIFVEENGFFDEKSGNNEVCREVIDGEGGLEDPFREIGEKLERLDRRSRKIGEIMRRFGRKTDLVCDEIDSWLAELNAQRLDEVRRVRAKIRPKIKVIERKHGNNSNNWDLFDDVEKNGGTVENRTLFTLPENHSFQDYFEDDDDDIFV